VPDLIPIAVRQALRDAVGGWGPYTVREVDELFNAFGFFDQDTDIDDVGGQRRTRAETFHRRINFEDSDSVRRYLALVDEVLLNYADDPEHPRYPGESLRRSLRRAGITRSSSGRFELPGSEEDTELALDEATQDLWRTDRIRLFLSHTSAHKQQVGELAEELNRYAFSCFVAHDEIELSREWQDVIELALRSCDVLVAYVTPDFNQSQWTEQEVGWALGRELVVVPLRVGIDPYGFFGAYQALRIRPEDSAWHSATAISRTISLAIFGIQRPGARRLLPRMTETAIDAFCSSRSYESARRRFEIIRHIPKESWTVAHIENVGRALKTNSQLRECVLPLDPPTPAPDAVAALLGRHGLSLPD
jgi:hypothetical protein